MNSTRDYFTDISGFPGSSAGKESACNAGNPGSIPGSGRSTGEGKGYTLQYSGLDSSLLYIVHGVAKSQTGLSDSLSRIYEVYMHHLLRLQLQLLSSFLLLCLLL